ncbi:alpha/beta hydrolase [Chimaeribacter californicus]|uniref:Alpha/beta hydrolase n=1 Tax=Chimaeribacter californicus TaxID=2060067 RepID=A0A2N5DW73_9GAMM|nr:alpha/beta hydrolase [Chimaeribacter californicus]PLR31452.1 alpha/beta hydrolase [Chimaeribacter californicus]
MATFVLVHGAFQGAWVWSRLARLLRQQGHDVYTPTLTGLGERAHLAGGAITLDTHIQDIVNVFHYEDIQEAVLCGHSYGGMVITGVANQIPGRLRALVFIDAFVPAAGESLIDVQGEGAAALWVAQAAETGGMIPPLSAALFNVNEADAARIDALSLPQPLGTFVQAVQGGIEAPALRALHRTFIFAGANGGDWFVSTHLRLKDHPDWRVHDIACGHNIMLDRPEELAARLLEETTR